MNMYISMQVCIDICHMNNTEILPTNRTNVRYGVQHSTAQHSGPSHWVVHWPLEALTPSGPLLWMGPFCPDGRLRQWRASSPPPPPPHHWSAWCPGSGPPLAVTAALPPLCRQGPGRLGNPTLRGCLLCPPRHCRGRRRRGGWVHVICSSMQWRPYREIAQVRGQGIVSTAQTTSVCKAYHTEDDRKTQLHESHVLFFF